jgi:hypothetical protein
VVAGLLLLGAVAAVAHHHPSGNEGVQTTSPTAPPAPIPLPTEDLDIVARQVAAMGTPTGAASYSEGLRSEAFVRLGMGDQKGTTLATDPTRVFSVVVPGHFVDTKAHIPPGASDPTGTYLVLTLSESPNPMVLDFGLQGDDPDLGSTGSVATVPLPTGTATGQALPCVGAGLRLPSTAIRVQVDLEVQSIDGRTVIRHETVPDGERYDFTLPAGQYRIGTVPGYPVTVTVLAGQETVVPDESCK